MGRRPLPLAGDDDRRIKKKKAVMGLVFFVSLPPSLVAVQCGVSDVLAARRRGKFFR
jgi:hypothetical protein